MHSRFFIGFLILIGFGTARAVSIQKLLDRSSFYAAMASSKLEEINDQLNSLKASSFTEKEAYEGALMMKKAGMVAGTKEKMNLFKGGRTKLENSIGRDRDNAEFRFLRLIIQEHAPKMLNYKSDLDKDVKLIRTYFKTLPEPVQSAIIDYSKKSTLLKPAYFQ